MVATRPKEKQGERLQGADSSALALPAVLLEPGLALDVLQEFQEEHDVRFHADVMAMPHDKQIEHSAFHVAKLAGLLATICEKKHHGESTEEIAFAEDRIADLLVFALKLANLYHVDLDEVYRRRLADVERKRQA